MPLPPRRPNHSKRSDLQPSIHTNMGEWAYDGLCNPVFEHRSVNLLPFFCMIGKWWD